MEAVASTCEAEAPYISYEISTQGFDNSGITATITVLDSAGGDVQGPLPGQSLVGRLSYPGGVVDSSDGLRAKVRVAGDLETSAAVQYPAESAECVSTGGQSSPPAPQAVAGASGSLPQTGGTDPSTIVWIATGALVAGALISAASYRRRSAATFPG